ncbi:Poc4p [Saccharomyces paradoxus]|uniref:Poc4p n=1 Tax=Saccharomyces paradoxus TaxID=27291 RepID=A0A8B8V0Y1_SACPA|nr:Poc4 [Saccharomyces paradoxus]QHS76594.1 Poc4 [Saccharomyces paradoxus]
MLVKTVSRTIESESGFLRPTLDVIATVPADDHSKKIPISLVVGFKQGASLNSALSLACYYYAIPLAKDRHMSLKSAGNNVVGIPLLDTNDDRIRDMTRRLATIISEKFNRPCYVTWSSLPRGDPSMLVTNHLYILKKCLDLLKTELGE